MTADDNSNTPIDGEILLRGKRVETDAHGNVCLNDIWALAGKPENKRARDWYRSKRAHALEVALQQRIVEISHKPLKVVAGSTYYTRGRGGGSKTFAHPVLALDYAEYIDPAIGVDVREVFIRFKANDVRLALAIMEGITSQAEYDEERIDLRTALKRHNKLSAGAAKAAGVTDFPAYNGAGLFGLYEMTKTQLLSHKGLPPDTNHLDHAGHEELAANYFKATQAIAKIRRDKIIGQRAANDAHQEVAQATRRTILELGGVMPEDEPALEHIKAAEKRLKAATPKEMKVLPPMPPRKPKGEAA
jgi:KilA-N domain